ncbi:alpha-glucan family phosphorylase [Marinobacter oulmenensis]|uniref:Starch phosphorylase n=1 Tax=Marinobacter oulmenensis TaxID=643747 RepID=A0A840U5X9_9GAMM|nr:starch phosphorylase [Marinobacter oulmenensis]
MTLAGYINRTLPDDLAGLATLALDLRWSWHHGSDQLWRAIEPDLWDATHNAWLVLNSVSVQHLQSLAGNREFLAIYRRQIRQHREFTEAATWYSDTHAGELDSGIAWFSMEFGVSECLPLYSGGLGVLAGDFLKAASDLGVPVIAIGLLYQQGYFRQALDANGEQLEFYPYNDPTMLPVVPLRDHEGLWLRIPVPFPGRTLRLRVWKGQVGRCELLLLDANDPMNEPGDRGVTSELYSGDREKRLQQEMVLGIGGWRLLERLGRHPSVCHINEGHPAFALVERAQAWQRLNGGDFETARIATRASNLFTTHTSVAAGFDHFPNTLTRLYLQPWLESAGNSLEALLSIANGGQEDLNMAGLALGMSGRFNAVSEIHQRVTQTIFQPWFGRWPARDIPAEYVTNGVHTPSWDSPEADQLWTAACGKDRWRRPMPQSCPLADTTDEALWQMRRAQRRRLVDYLRKRLLAQHCEQDFYHNRDAACGLMLDPETLTLGFARRFTAYKRLDLLLREPERLVAMLNNRDRPLQIVLAGKAHPKDEEGKAILHRWKTFSMRADVEGKVIFIEDYDLFVASQLVQGVDVWLNNPRHPWEACGTSGMKVLVNGGLNLSQYDGWWAEAWNEQVGWAIRPGASFEQLSQDPGHDASDADSLYRLLEEQVIPDFYELDERGLPDRWLHRVRSSMDQLTARYSANRMVREYVEQFYIPMARAGAERTPEQAAMLLQRQENLYRHWPRLRFGRLVQVEEEGQQLFTLDVYLDGLGLDQVEVDMVAEASDAGGRVVEPMQMIQALAGSTDSYQFQCRVAPRPEGHYTPRIRARDEQLNLPLEAPLILWFR